MFALKRLAQHLELEEPIVETGPSPSEKVLEWAHDLPASRPHMENEVKRIENLIAQIEISDENEEGADFLLRLADILYEQIDGILGFLESVYAEDFQWSCSRVLSSHAKLRDLEEDLGRGFETVPVFA